MGSVAIEDYLNLLTKPEHYEKFCQLLHAQLSQPSLSEHVSYEFFYVLKCALKQISFNQSSTHFESAYLKRVVSKFKTDPEFQALELQIFDAILIEGQKRYGLTSAKVPAIVRIRRDKPLIRPDSILMANSAAKLRDLLQQEAERPTTLASVDQLRGRLLLHLFLLERVESIDQAMLMLTTMPPVYYADGVVYLEFQYKKVWCRYVLSEAGGLLWMQWLRVQGLHSSSVSKPAAYYIQLFLAALPQWQHDALGVSRLKLLKKIDHTLRYSPIHYEFYSGYIQSQLLGTAAFVRLLTERCVPYGGEPEPVNEALLTVREQRAWRGQLIQGNYASVATQLAELKRVLGSLRPPSGKSSTALLAASRTELTDGFTHWLQQHADSHMPYLWFLVLWARSLFKHGGRVKRSLKPGTIIDYVTTIGTAFLSIFNGFKLADLDGVDWVELLNRTSDEVKSPSRKGFVLYFANFLRDAELVPDLPVSELDIAVSHGGVDANVLSINHAEAILHKLLTQQDAVAKDAHLLFCFCFYSGLRRNEAAFLQLADLDFAVVEPTQGDNDHVDLHIRRNHKRGLKSSAANRCLPLDALWPAEHLSRLRARLQYQRARGEGPQSLLFDSPTRSVQAYRLITDLMQEYTGDRSLRIHHLRHSFANWTWFRLNPALLQVGRQQLSMLQGTYYADAAVTYFYRRLGIHPYSRKGMYVLCHLLGHEEPATTIGSYLHLKDLMGYLAMGAEEPATQKLLNHTLGRSTLTVRRELGESLALRLGYETRALERLVSPARSPVELSSSLPSIKLLTHCFDVGRKSDAPRRVVEWAAVLMVCRSCLPEQVAYQESLTSVEVRGLLDNAAKVQRLCPGRGKPLPLIPALAPWVNRLIAVEHTGTVPDKGKEEAGSPTGVAGSEGRAVSSRRKPDSHSLQVLRYLFTQLQNGLDNGQLSWAQIKDGCQILKYLVPGKGYLIRCPSSKRMIRFLTLCGLLGFKARHIRLKLHLGEIDETQQAGILASWDQFLTRSGVCGLSIELAKLQDNPYLRKHDGLGVMEVRLVNRQLGSEGRRQRVFISLLQLLLILSLSLGSQ